MWYNINTKHVSYTEHGHCMSYNLMLHEPLVYINNGARSYFDLWSNLFKKVGEITFLWQDQWAGWVRVNLLRKSFFTYSL